MMNTASPRPPALVAAEIDWQSGQPVSARYGDVYFSRDDGLAESRYVFLAQNRLAERFARLGIGEAFVVAETGFGTGLNFLATWQLWRDSAAPEGATLHFVSMERHPLTPNDLARAIALWPELAPLGEALLAQYPALTEGLHRLTLDGGRVRLSLYFGDALAALSDLRFTADAWFLDGFAPARNPDLWAEQITSAIARHSHEGTTLATFTSVGRVRRALADVGFVMSKSPGYGRKREMLTGVFTVPGKEARPQAAEPEAVIIIGAGIAGCLLAHNLAQRGRRVTVLDAGDDAGAGASGNPQGALYVKLGVDFNPQTQLALSALLFSQRFYPLNAPTAWHGTGLFQMAYNHQEADRQQRFLERNDYPDTVLTPVSAAEASEFCGLAVPAGGLWFANSGWLTPKALCRALLDHPNIHAKLGFRVTRLMPCNGRWHVSGQVGPQLAAHTVVLCAGHKTPDLLPASGGFRFRAIRGQVTSVPSEALHAPRAVICGSRYLNPNHDGQCLTGATFDLHDASENVSADSHLENLRELSGNLPALWRGPQAPSPAAVSGRVAFRCTTHDYQPTVGTLTSRTGKVLEGMEVFTGLGSKGLAYAPLLVEFLADRLTGQPEALPLSLSQRLGPERCRVADTQKSA
ncbi:MAG: bifunctional tRNA (5-methylaminomethyl-2-thiouridine)(34)-methyltransferase MnmD/FAD-dependent 5-carboxymethylaminomethyl-2-thiouridine(34) oxidoreductase MnmC [Marinobacter sp.]|nr:bifunctional tRNA (5-methylaminomethyl-2-thiouridine)(34)-methyltransferase MnmD/FAD-dependent 5-carboxymethylaminomethyl-2-thiouridine(34) oxidoreductase MnmC [Marinobacter sp.]MDX1634270.1 bifunctional tRNA (5-methylaminomethyl-2-thiouridine)(34)-methyltransferase MnmD/FAD-dependent 5-carboxymethylaminomethyl-2-thiouridine(34) oxidoreductase MnmC [Marinobacter sp.]